MSEPRKTSLNDSHLKLNARMVDFSNFLMPLQYSGIVEEHLAVRSCAGLFDVSHMGEFFVSGDGSESFLDRLTVNDVRSLKPGEAQYSLMCREDGGIIDDLLIYRFEDRFMVVVNAGNIKKDFEWLKSHLSEGTNLVDVSDETGLIAVQGPKSRDILQKVFNQDLSTVSFYTFLIGLIGKCDVTIARTGYTGELGFEIYCQVRDAESIWGLIHNSGAEDGLVPVGLGCRDTLRMEMKYCLYGNDIDETTNPIEAGLGWGTNLSKENFEGKDAIVRAKENVTRCLVCFEMVERAVPRRGYKIWKGSDEVGVVTSGTQSPSLKKGIGLGYVAKELSNAGKELEIDIRGNRKTAVISKPPLYKNGSLYN